MFISNALECESRTVLGSMKLYDWPSLYSNGGCLGHNMVHFKVQFTLAKSESGLFHLTSYTFKQLFCHVRFRLPQEYVRNQFKIRRLTSKREPAIRAVYSNVGPH